MSQPIPIRRYHLQISLFLASAAIALAGAGHLAAGAQAMTARTADSMVNSIGVATHTTYNDTVYYQRFSELKTKLAKLGVRHIREDLMPNRPDQYSRLNELAAMGIGSTLIMGSPSNSTATLDGLLAVVRTKLDRVDALEGSNEYYLSGKSNWGSLATEYQRRLYESAKASPATAAIPILGPSTVFWQVGETGDISQWLDYGTIHPYPGAYPSEEYLSRHMDFATRSSATKPVIATETGYHNAMDYGGGHVPVSEATSAVYLPRLFLDNFDRGVRRTFTYELVDSFPNAANNDCESHFGLLRNDLSEKPAFTALKNMISVLADPGPSFQPGSLDVVIDGNRADLREVLLQKRDGRFYLALWRTTRVWNPDKRAAINPGSATVTVSAPGLRAAQVYLPSRSETAIETRAASAGKLSVDVGAEVLILALSEGANGSPDVGPAQEVEAPPVNPGAEGPTQAPTPAPAPVGAETPSAPTGSNGTSSGRGGRESRQRKTHVKVWTTRRTVRPGGRVAVRARVVGDAPGKVVIQRWDGAWRTIAKGSTGSRSLRETVPVPADAAGRISLRVVVGHLVSSRPVRLRVNA